MLHGTWSNHSTSYCSPVPRWGKALSPSGIAGGRIKGKERKNPVKKIVGAVGHMKICSSDIWCPQQLLIKPHMVDQGLHGHNRTNAQMGKKYTVAPRCKEPLCIEKFAIPKPLSVGSGTKNKNILAIMKL